MQRWKHEWLTEFLFFIFLAELATIIGAYQFVQGLDHAILECVNSGYMNIQQCPALQQFYARYEAI